MCMISNETNEIIIIHNNHLSITIPNHIECHFSKEQTSRNIIWSHKRNQRIIKVHFEIEYQFSYILPINS